MKTKTALLLTLILSTPLAAHAISVTGYGTYATTSTASNCTVIGSCGTDNNGDFQFDRNGGESITKSISSQNTYATARSSANLTGNTYLPILQVETRADFGKGATATATGVQGYTYTGVDSFMFDLDFNLHGSVVTNGYAGTNELKAQVAILTGSQFDLYSPNFSDLYYENSATPLAKKSLTIADGIDVNSSDSLSFVLNNGDTFFILASISARSVDGFVDACNTLSLDYQNDQGLVAASAPQISAVPVPAAAWLFGTALLGFVGVGKRKKVTV